MTFTLPDVLFVYESSTITLAANPVPLTGEPADGDREFIFIDVILYVSPVIVGPAFDIEKVIAEAASLQTVLPSGARSGMSFMLKIWGGVIQGPVPQPFDPATVTL